MTDAKVTVMMSKANGGLSGDYWTLRIVDNASGILVVDVDLTLEQFARAIGHTVIDDAKASYGRLALVGMKHELKSKLVTPNQRIDLNWAVRLAEAVAPFEVDGWVARVDADPNPNRWTPGGFYSVTFDRWVAPGLTKTSE